MLSRIPDPGIIEDGEYIMAQYKIEGADLVGNLAIELQGVKRSELLAASANTEPRDRELLLKRIINYPRKHAEATSIELKYNQPSLKFDENPSGNKLVLKAEVVEKNAAKKIGDKIYLDLQPLRDAMLEPVDMAGRTRPYTLPYGYINSYTYFVLLPEGYKVDSLPEPFSTENDWYNATIAYDVKDGAVMCVAKIETKALEASCAEIAGRNDWVKALKRASATQVVLSPL